VRAQVSEISITTDIMVGFPGEEDRDFEDTLRVVEAIGFDAVFVFKYSDRPGTAAAGWNDDVPRAEKERRHAVLLAAADAQARRRGAALAGRPAEVLVEGINGLRAWGKTRTGRVLDFPAGDARPGDLITVIQSTTNCADHSQTHEHTA
jgi:tRNA-2-methylthio-N6-dimethylallyladenosine synthase